MEKVYVVNLHDGDEVFVVKSEARALCEIYRYGIQKLKHYCDRGDYDRVNEILCYLSDEKSPWVDGAWFTEAEVRE